MVPGQEKERPPPGGPAAKPEELLLGRVERITYRDESSLYTVLRLAPEGALQLPGALFAGERVTAVGRASEVEAGERVRLVGHWTSHPHHGQQFEFSVLEPLVPADEEGLVRYLASPHFPGIGEVLARRIVKKLGPGALDTIQASPAALAGIRGLKPKVAEELREKLATRANVHQALAFLRGLGLGPLQSQNALAELGPDCEGVLREDPYQLTRVHGMGFQTADRIARGLGFEAEDPRRLRAGLCFALEEAGEEGHTALPLAALRERAGLLLGLGLEGERWQAALTSLERSDRLQIERGLFGLSEPYADEAWAYLPWLYGSERGVAQSLLRLAAAEAGPLASALELDAAEQALAIELHPDQRAAVLTLLSHPVGLLTGGPGVGKTTIVRLIATLAERAGTSVALASPTGRAAKRLAEATGRPASTIHRLLGYQPHTGFERGADKPLEQGLVLIDESSMLDVHLAHALLKAVRSPTRVVFVGDPDQLPSVGPGNVLRDMIASQKLPVARLSHIWRQARGSLIIENAHAIREGRLPTLPERGDKSADFYFFPAEEAAQAAERVVEVVTSRIPRAFGLDWLRDVQVIAPMYRGDCGVDALNERLREAQTTRGRELVRAGERWRTGDRVIQVRNDYEKEVFNGDMGRIVAIAEDGLVTVRYPEQDVVYTPSGLSDLRPAYAITVHRSQGAEFPAVVVPLLLQHRLMLRRNLLYTAVTRAKRLVVLVGSMRAIELAVADDSEERRYSALAERLGAEPRH